MLQQCFEWVSAHVREHHTGAHSTMKLTILHFSLRFQDSVSCDGGLTQRYLFQGEQCLQCGKRAPQTGVGSQPNCRGDQNKFLSGCSLSVFNIRSVVNRVEFGSSEAAEGRQIHGVSVNFIAEHLFNPPPLSSEIAWKVNIRAVVRKNIRPG